MTSCLAGARLGPAFAVAWATATPAQTVVSLPETSRVAGDWSYLLGTATDDRSKGISKSAGDPYGWVEAEWENASATFYAGAVFEIDRSRSELDATIGIREAAAGFRLDLSLTRKWKQATDDAREGEWHATAQIDRPIGRAKARVVLQYSPGGLGSNTEWSWIEARAGWAFNDVLTGSVAVGRRQQDDDVNYIAWNAGVSLAVAPAVGVDLRYYDTNVEEVGAKYDSAVVAELTISF